MPDDPRLTRYATAPDLRLTRHAQRSGAVVGAPPTSVEYGLPGARDEVRAYAGRIDAAWTAFQTQDLAPWLASLPRDTTGKIMLASGQRATLDMIRDRRTAFAAYKTQIDTFDITGPSPSQAWQRLQLFEDDYKDSREQFSKMSGKPLASPGGKPLEQPGGVPSGGIPWGGILAVGGALAVAWGLSSVVRIAKG